MLLAIRERENYYSYCEALNNLSAATEEIEIAINEIKSLMERENMRHKLKLKTKGENKYEEHTKTPPRQ